MYVCICHKITEEQVRSLLTSGKTAKEIARGLGLGSDCGVCVIDGIEKLIESSPQTLKNQNNK